VLLRDVHLTNLKLLRRPFIELQPVLYIGLAYSLVNISRWTFRLKLASPIMQVPRVNI